MTLSVGRRPPGKGARTVLVLALLLASSSCLTAVAMPAAAPSGDMVLQGSGHVLAGPALPTASPPPAPVLIVIPMHTSEPTSNLEDMAACVFRHPPTTGRDLRFDVLVAMSGTEPDGRGPELRRILQGATQHVLPAPPGVDADFVQMKNDAYDRDNRLGRRSSYAGPNTAFYDVMLGDGGVHRRYTSRYAYVQVMETDCCALRGGWLDELLAPMLTMPHILISGSHVQATCYSSSELERCLPAQDIPP